MRAAVLTAYGTPLQIREVPLPIPGPREVLVRIMASGVNPLDIKIRRGEAAHAKMTPPAILGIDMAGVVKAVGAQVDQFRVGDEVFGMTGGVGGVAGPGVGLHRNPQPPRLRANLRRKRLARRQHGELLP